MKFKEANTVRRLGIHLVSLAIFVSCAQAVIAENRVVDKNEIAGAVRNLGEDSEDISDELRLLKCDQSEAIKLLIAQLHSIPHKVYYERSKTKDSRHVIACLKALHELTGQEFTATSSQNLTDDEKQFLDSPKLHFFGWWMSRNADFVAPIDAQKKIIEQWKQWQNK